MENTASPAPQPQTETPSPTEAKDLGFGSKILGKHVRLVNPDGSANVEKLGRPWFRPYDIYLTLIYMSWGRFALAVMLFYFVENLIFSLLYMLAGVENLSGVLGETMFEKFLDAFFFSSQTVTTLGYGRIAPVGTVTSIIAAVESLIGLMGFALVTGLVWGRFSRAEAKIKFSESAVVAPYEEISGLMIRLANERSSQLIEAEAVLTMSFFLPGTTKRDYERLELEIDRITFLAMSWTVVHPITKESPLYGWSKDEMKARGLELILMIKAFDDSFGSTVYQRRSYTADEIRWGEKFVTILDANERSVTLDMARLGDSAKADLPQY